MTKFFVRYILFAVIILGCATMLSGQGVLENDTLYIGNVSAIPGEHIEVPLYIKTTEYYQGWTFPLIFGNGTSPVTCDSVSLLGTIMETWTWTSVFINNNQWDNVQTCGGTGVYVWVGDSLDPGYYLAMRLFFTVDTNANPPLTVRIDTTTCSFVPGGQQNGFLVVVNLQAWYTIIVPGAIEITLPGIDENNEVAVRSELMVSPSITRSNNTIKICFTNVQRPLTRISLYDIKGARIDEVYRGIPESETTIIDYRLKNLANGVYLVVFEDDTGTHSRKIIVN